LNYAENEIIYKMAITLSPEEAVDNPEEYLARGYYKDPEMYELTKSVISSVIQNHPALFFHYHLDEDPVFSKEKNKAALRLVEKEPLAALFVYKFHRRNEFDYLWIPLLHELLEDLKDIESAKKDSNLVVEIAALVDAITQRYPDFARTELKNLPRTESGESEYKL